jgi:hypothetical protein
MGQWAVAQTDLPDSLRFTVRKDYVPVARDAARLVPQPRAEADTVTKMTMRYEVLPRQAATVVAVEPIQAAKLTNEPLEKINPGHARIGFGNYTMPLVEVGYGTVRNKNLEASGLARYHASYAKLDGRPFGFTDIDLMAQGRYFWKDYTIDGRINYAHDRNFFYGYNPTDTSLTRDEVTQYFHRTSLDLGIGSADRINPKMLSSARLRYAYTADRYSSVEHAIGLQAQLAFALKKSRMLANVSGAYYSNAMPSGTRSNGIISLGPEFSMQRERWAVAIGINMGLDIYDTTTKVSAFPKIDFHYFLVKDIWRLYANANGGFQRNGLDALAQRNPWMQTDFTQRNSQQHFLLKVGFKGIVIKKLSYDVGITETVTGNMPFFVNDLSNGIGNRFRIEYHDVNIFGINGELGYLWGERLSTAARAEYRFFTMPNDSIRPWHESPFRFSFNARYNLRDKIIIKAEIYAQGVRQARTTYVDTDGAVRVRAIDLAGYADVNLGAEYRYRKWIGAFIDFRNVAALRYEQFYLYPSQRFGVMAGLNFNF